MKKIYRKNKQQTNNKKLAKYMKKFVNIKLVQLSIK